MIYPNWEPSVSPPIVDPEAQPFVTSDSGPDGLTVLLWQRDPITGQVTVLERIHHPDPPAHWWIAAEDRARLEITRLRNARIDPARLKE